MKFFGRHFGKAAALAAAALISTAPAFAADELPSAESMGASSQAMPADGTETYHSLMVTAEWLKANLKNVIVLDARPTEQYKGQQGHIPGAISVPIDYYANMNGNAGDPKWHTLAEEANLVQRLGKIGIDGKKEVIIYGDGGDWGNAVWGIWALRSTGNKKARFLDGGWSAWRAAGGDRCVKGDSHSAKAVSHPAFKLDSSYIVTTDWMKEHLHDPAIKIVDVRTTGEYTGANRFFGEKRPGHIPGAVQFDMGEVLTPDFKVLPEAELKAKIGAMFPNKAQEIILYDTNGVRGAFMTMVFRLAGYPNARNYDASYNAWCADKDTEIAQGPNP